MNINDLFLESGIIAAGYFGALLVVQALGQAISPKINSEAQLEEVVDKEASKIGVDRSNLLVFWLPQNNPTKYGNIKRNVRCAVQGYDPSTKEFVRPELIDGKKIKPIQAIYISEGNGSNLDSIRHELYHLKHHFPKSNNTLIKALRWFYQEPAATFYGLTGLDI